jgi:hypothetical protein
VEQLSSDERILGALPEDAAGVLLNWAVARLDATAASAPDEAAFATAADAVFSQARQIADEAAGRGDDAETLARYLASLDAQPVPDGPVSVGAPDGAAGTETTRTTDATTEPEPEATGEAAISASSEAEPSESVQSGSPGDAEIAEAETDRGPIAVGTYAEPPVAMAEPAASPDTSPSEDDRAPGRGSRAGDTEDRPAMAVEDAAGLADAVTKRVGNAAHRLRRFFHRGGGGA